jgi:hypothetical protein
MSPGYLAWLLTKSKAEIIDSATYTLLLTWIRPRDVKR